MEPEADRSKAPPEQQADNQIGSPFLGTAVVLIVIVAIAYLIFDSHKVEGSSSSYNIGGALACGLLSLVSASVIRIVFSGFPRNRSMWWNHFYWLSGPLEIAGAFWIWRMDAIAADRSEKAEDARRLHEDVQEENSRTRKAERVINSARRKFDDSIRKRIRENEGVISIEGWRAAPLDDGKWLVEFTYLVNNDSRWMLFEYDEYLNDFRSVFSDDSLSKYYLETTEEGASLNSETRRRLGEWVGPVR